MERWANRVAVVTGASASIGAAIVKRLAEKGMVVIGLACHKEKVESLRDEVKPEARNRIHGIVCDICVESQVIDVFKEIERTYGPVAVLVNSGVMRRETKLSEEGNIVDIPNTNVYDIVYSTREAFRSMKENDRDGHVFLINCVPGHSVPYVPDSNIYEPSKYAVTAMNKLYSQEFSSRQTKVKVTIVSPDVSDSDGIRKNRGNMPEGCDILLPHDISFILILCLSTPPNVQVQEIFIKSLGRVGDNV